MNQFFRLFHLNTFDSRHTVITSLMNKADWKVDKVINQSSPKPIQNLTKQNQNETQKTEKPTKTLTKPPPNSTNNKKKKIQLGWIFLLTLWITRIYYFTLRTVEDQNGQALFTFLSSFFYFSLSPHLFKGFLYYFISFFPFKKKNDGKLQEYQGF